MEDDSYIQVGQAPLSEAKRLQSLLEMQGVKMRLVSDPEGCGSCSPKVTLCLRQQDVAQLEALLRKEHLNDLGDLRPEAHSTAVFDAEQAEATCPACGTVFSTQKTECPDCGLGFGPIGE